METETGTTNLSVKWLHKGEFRRFGVTLPTSGEGAYGVLLNKIQQITPSSQFQENFAWKDKDGDLIVVTSDEELKEAIRCITDNTLRIYTVVRLPDGRVVFSEGKINGAADENVSASHKTTPMETSTNKALPTDKSTDGGVHKNISCDGCESELRGIRFKCLTCPDFDLCSMCQTEGMHKEHVMLRIADPTDKTWRRMFFVSQSRFGPPCGPPPFGVGFAPFCRGFPGARGCHGDKTKEEKAAKTDTEASQEQFDWQQFATEGANFLKQVGEQVTAALDDMGVDVEHGKNATEPTPTTNGDQESTETPRVKPSTNTTDTNAGPTNGTAASNVAQGIINVLRHINPEQSQQVWALIEAAVPPVKETVTTQPLETPPTTSTAQLQHPNPLIQHALDHMTSMGFTNEGGWLTSLLEQKSGHVNAVLDAIKPRTHQHSK